MPTPSPPPRHMMKTVRVGSTCWMARRMPGLPRAASCWSPRSCRPVGRVRLVDDLVADHVRIGGVAGGDHADEGGVVALGARRLGRPERGLGMRTRRASCRGEAAAGVEPGRHAARAAHRSCHALHVAWAKYGDQWNWWKSISTFTCTALERGDLRSSCREHASRPSGSGRARAAAAGSRSSRRRCARSSRRAAPRSGRGADCPTDMSKPRRTTGLPFWSTNLPPDVVTHGLVAGRLALAG